MIVRMRARSTGLTGAALALLATLTGAAEWNPLRSVPVAPGAASQRIIVGFRANPANTRRVLLTGRHGLATRDPARIETTPADVEALLARSGIPVAASRQISGSMHVLILAQAAYGVHVEALLDRLRRDPAVAFAEPDGRRHPLGATLPDDPLFAPTPGVASGQWTLLAPNAGITVEGVMTADLAATDAVDAWTLTTGSPGIVIADVDTGVLFDHPDLLRAGQGGRLLPGYDFVGEDYSPTSGAPLGTFLVANDGDGWDPDPTDPGDWISSADVANALFPTCACGDPSQDGGLIASSWHGTRVVGIVGALTNNNAGIAGMTWGNAAAPGPWVLPVRALGKCGGYDSDIIAGIEWAAGLPVTPPNAATSSTPRVPLNPFPADVINLSLGGSGSCSSAYVTALSDATAAGALVVISAGNGGAVGQAAPVDSPANCSLRVPGVIAVAGLRNVGTKVGYSSFGPEVGVGAPAGNCVSASGNCLRSIDTTTNSGTTGADPAGSGYTGEQDPNLGTSFAAPIVSGIAALMRSVNANLTPAQLVARLEASATPFPPNTGALPVCPDTGSSSGECACPQPAPGVVTQCGVGMVNALQAVTAALAPIVAVVPPTAPFGSAVAFDAGGSVAACGSTLAGYAWSANPAALISGDAASARISVNPAVIAPGATGTLMLTVTDTAGHAATGTLVLGPGAVLSNPFPASAGAAATACPAALAINPAAPAPPTVSAVFSPATVAPDSPATLTLTLGNGNPYALTGASLHVTLPAGALVAAGTHARTSCTGAAAAVAASATVLTLSGAILPAAGSCVVLLELQAAGVGSYPVTVPPAALTTAPAGPSVAAASANLVVVAPAGGGGGALQWPGLILGAAGLWLLRRHSPKEHR
jgi:serine protease